MARIRARPPAILFSRDNSVVLLSFLLIANLIRLYFPGLPADVLVGGVILVFGVSLLRGQFPVAAVPTLVSFVVLLGIYGAGLFWDYNYQGVRHFFGILFAGIVFLFCYRNGPTIGRMMPNVLLCGLILMMFPMYWIPSGMNPNGFVTTLVYMVLTIGLFLIIRTTETRNQHKYAVALFILAGILGLLYGYRSLVLSAILSIAFYWAGFRFLRSWVGVGTLVLSLGLLVCSFIVLVGTSHSEDEWTLTRLDKFGERFVGGRFRTGREALWSATLERISEAPWFGNGTGSLISDPPVWVDSLRDPVQRRWLRLCSNTIVVPFPRKNRGLINDCATLMSVQDASTSGNDRPWTFSSSIVCWPGVIVAGTPPRVVAIILQDWSSVYDFRTELEKLIPVEPIDSDESTDTVRQGLGKLQHVIVSGLNRSDSTETMSSIPTDGTANSLVNGSATLSIPGETMQCQDYSSGVRSSGFGKFLEKLNRLIEPSHDSSIITSSHNQFLQVGLQTGIIGMVALGLLCVSLIFNFRARSGGTVVPLQSYTFAITSMFVLQNTFDTYMLQAGFSTGVLGWILIGIGAGEFNRIRNSSCTRKKKGSA